MNDVSQRTGLDDADPRGLQPSASRLGEWVIKRELPFPLAARRPAGEHAHDDGDAVVPQVDLGAGLIRLEEQTLP